MATAHMSGLTGLRGEFTALRKEVVVNTSTLRSLVKKTNDIATVADRLAASLISHRHIFFKVPSNVAAAVARLPASGSAAVVMSAGDACGTPACAFAAATVPPRQLPTDETHVKEAYWVMKLKGELKKWLLDCFLNAACTADIWISTADVNAFLRDWVAGRFAVALSDAIKLLEKQERLPVRPKRRKRAAPAAPLQNRTISHVLLGTSSKDWTVAYRYLHFGIFHLYLRIGAKSVSAFASHVDEELNEGSLCRLRGTKTSTRWYSTSVTPRGCCKTTFFSTTTNAAMVCCALSPPSSPPTMFFPALPRQASSGITLASFCAAWITSH